MAPSHASAGDLPPFGPAGAGRNGALTEDAASDAWARFPDVRPAPRRVGHRDCETAMSVLVRLSLANGMRDVGHLLRSTPHLRIKQVLNRETRIEVAARLSGFDASGIDAATPTRMTGGQMSVAGVAFSRRGTLPGRTCPACIGKDLQAFSSERIDLRAYRRGWWQVPSISTCPTHGVGLVAACGGCGHALDERVPVGRCRCGAARLPDTAVARDACRHDAWLLGRLGFAPVIVHRQLDAMPPDVAAELCRILGSSAMDERAGSGRQTDAARLAEARSLGWRILLAGDAELERVLDEIVVRNRSRGSVCNTGYGGLHRFLTLNTDPALEPVRDQVLAHARSNVGLSGARARLFGRAVVDGERLSLTQAAKIVGVAESLLANILVALDPDFQLAPSGPTLLDRVQLLGAKDAVQGTMRSTEMKAVLGFDRHMMGLAIERGSLRCLIPPAPGHFGLVWRNDVGRIARLFDRVPVVPTAGLLAPAPFAKAGGVAGAEVMVGVVEGRLLPAGRRQDVAGFQGLLFDPASASELWPVLRGEMPRRRLAEALGWMPQTISELQRRRLLKAEGFEAVRMDAVKSFRSRYASAEEARGWLESPPRGTGPMHALLRAVCGQPVVTGKGVTAFWPRFSMAAKLRPLMRAGANIHAIGFGSRDYPRNRHS
ncbi:MAG: TniQ family protein [Sphingomonas sp.]|uniref:TniQ family protein n=1 Tax=Sphingomonas sp. TaxID=28214 RepID=UPI0026106073|nr:TniQ family protein [Sphingomonas sp.]MDK2768284.1 TniQ family protein [Sphingomonas sp.]